jgi:hypothetical protein
MRRARLPSAGRARRFLTRRWRVVIEDLPLLLQQTAAATVAWLIAKRVVDHHEPFFAPKTALVSLNTQHGERGLNAVRLLQGVVLGIAVGELALLVLGGGYGTLALATFLALTLARAFGSARIVLAQSAVSAILTVAVARGEVGFQRLGDALIGTGVALVFSQALFSPEPLRLLRRHETNALEAMAEALHLTAQALEGDDALAERAIRSQRELRDQLSDFARMRHTTSRAARHSLVWRGRVAPVVGETEDAGHLDLLGGSCLLLTRAVLETQGGPRLRFAPYMRSFGTILADLAHDPGDREGRQHAVHRSLATLRELREMYDAIDHPDPDVGVVLTAARVAATDLMLFVGVDPVEARAATRPEASEERVVDVPAPRAASPSAFARRARRLADRIRPPRWAARPGRRRSRRARRARQQDGEDATR